MAARAPLEAFRSPLMLSFLVSLPETMIFAPSELLGTMPASCNEARLTSPWFSFSSSWSRTSAIESRVSEWKPRFGRRRCSGIWPPSKPSLWKPPERAFWPLWPRPAVLPQPEPTPRPTRCRSFLDPGAGFNEFNRMSVLDAHQVGDAVDHAAHF